MEKCERMPRKGKGWVLDFGEGGIIKEAMFGRRERNDRLALRKIDSKITLENNLLHPSIH